MERHRHAEAKPQPGEWAVFHERPFPKRLDRAFRVGAIVAGIIGAAALVAWIGVAGSTLDGGQKVAVLAGLALTAAGMAYGFVRAVGLIVTSLHSATQRKQYVLDWHEPPTAEQKRRKAAAIVAATLLLMLALWALTNFA
ncbi:hypothetical protein [Methylorubrum thiocyanatum]|uniref:hypothetical protein n=1 Tax=Methylorubrum thiocyanatum TaxID=47958 RepID=UPI00398C4743